MAQSAVDDELWEEFHRVVNMTSRELEEWLRTHSADEGTEPLPDQAGTETGQHVVHIPSKRRTDLPPRRAGDGQRRDPRAGRATRRPGAHRRGGALAAPADDARS